MNGANTNNYGHSSKTKEEKPSTNGHSEKRKNIYADHNTDEFLIKNVYYTWFCKFPLEL